jgi:hypothetical protein
LIDRSNSTSYLCLISLFNDTGSCSDSIVASIDRTSSDDSEPVPVPTSDRLVIPIKARRVPSNESSTSSLNSSASEDEQAKSTANYNEHEPIQKPYITVSTASMSDPVGETVASRFKNTSQTSGQRTGNSHLPSATMRSGLSNVTVPDMTRRTSLMASDSDTLSKENSEPESDTDVPSRSRGAVASTTAPSTTVQHSISSAVTSSPLARTTNTPSRTTNGTIPSTFTPPARTTSADNTASQRAARTSEYRVISESIIVFLRVFHFLGPITTFDQRNTTTASNTPPGTGKRTRTNMTRDVVD